MEDTCAQCCTSDPLERVHFFPRQLLAAQDLTTEQDFFRQKLRRHNQFLHGWGVVCGAEVKANPDDEKKHPWRVRVCPGYILTPQGDEILVSEATDFDLASDWRQPHDPCENTWPCPPQGTTPQPGQREPVYLAVRYTECHTRPVRIPPVGCGCDDAGCDYSRIRESFELALLWQLPKSHRKAEEFDLSWAIMIDDWRKNGRLGAPVPPCAPCTTEPWIVLATIQLPKEVQEPIVAGNITYQHRRVVYTTATLPKS